MSSECQRPLGNRGTEVNENGTNNNTVSSSLGGESSPYPPLSMLTVGEGDFSCSLAILRAYGVNHQIARLVATTLLVNEMELFETYPYTSTREILHKLKKPSNEYGGAEVTIVFGVDATQLHLDTTVVSLGPYDYILFHHPHLGYTKDRGVPDLATRHSILLAHYLYSAKQLLFDPVLHDDMCTVEEEQPSTATTTIDTKKTPCIHVCLCAGQSKSWKLEKILSRLDLEYNECPRFVNKPIFPYLSPISVPLLNSHNTESSKLVSSQTNCWLGQYGYNHQPTHPATTRLSVTVNSHHHFFRKRNRTADNKTRDKTVKDDVRSRDVVADHNCKKQDDITLGTSNPDGVVNVHQGPCNGNDSSDDFVCFICHQRFLTGNGMKDLFKAPARPIHAAQAIDVDLEANQRLKKPKKVRVNIQRAGLYFLSEQHVLSKEEFS